MSEFEMFRAGVDALFAEITAFYDRHGLAGKALPDHVGHKCDSKETFEELRAMLEPESAFKYQSYISGRRIALFKLKQPFQTPFGSISVLELNDQKPDGSQSTGFDHVEIYPVGITYGELVLHLRGNGAEIEETVRSHHTTYDIILSDGHKLKLTLEPILEKVKRDEMF